MIEDVEARPELDQREERDDRAGPDDRLEHEMDRALAANHADGHVEDCVEAEQEEQRLERGEREIGIDEGGALENDVHLASEPSGGR